MNKDTQQQKIIDRLGKSVSAGRMAIADLIVKCDGYMMRILNHENTIERLKIEIGELNLVIESQDFKLHKAMEEIKRLHWNAGFDPGWFLEGE